MLVQTEMAMTSQDNLISCRYYICSLSLTEMSLCGTLLYSQDIQVFQMEMAVVFTLMSGLQRKEITKVFRNDRASSQMFM